MRIKGLLKKLSIISTSFFVVSLVVTSVPVHVAGAVGPTAVSGNISTNTIWTLDNSPYVVVGTVQVFEGITLTIEPGVVIKFNSGTGLNIGGELIAVGTDSNIILFTSNLPFPQPGDWLGIKFFNTAVDAIFDSNHYYISGSIIKYSRIQYGGGFAPTGLRVIDSDQTTLYIDHNVIEYNKKNVMFLMSAQNKITNNSIRENGHYFNQQDCSSSLIYLNSDNNYVSGNVIENNDINGLKISATSDDNKIKNNTFVNNACGIVFNGANYHSNSNNLISNNLITESNYAGIIFSPGNYTGSSNVIRNNNVANNDIGLLIDEYNYVDGTKFNNNNIQNNTSYNIKLVNSTTDINVIDNYWGTTNETEIDAKIFDYYDNISLGKVNYTPFAFTEIEIHDVVAPTLSEVSSVPSPTNSTSPAYTFASSEAGAIVYTGSCSSATTSAVVGNNTIIFSTLVDGIHADCWLTVTDVNFNTSDPLFISPFTVDTVAPTATISYSTNGPTNQNVVATLHPSETVIITNNSSLPTYTFLTNGGFTFEFVDLAGNTGSANATVDNIDLVAPAAIIIYSTTDPTTGNVVATLNPSEAVIVTNNGGNFTHSFSENGSFTFTFTDSAGNAGSSIATVGNIEKIPPPIPTPIPTPTPPAPVITPTAPVVVLPTPVVVLPTPIPQVLGASTFRPVIRTPTITNGALVYKYNGKTITLRPFGKDYKGAIWARSVDFGPNGKLLVFINSEPYKNGRIRVYNIDGKLFQSYNPAGGIAANGLNAVLVSESNDKVYLAVSPTRYGKTVQTFQIISKGIRVLSSLNASARAGNILIGFQKLYKNQYGLVTIRKYSPSTLKVWKLNFTTNRFVEDTKINKTKIKI